MQQLGKLLRVEPRTVWTHEGREFTPWLRENIQLLAEAIGLEIEVVETESAVGDYLVDLYAKELSTGAWVIIENQLEQTDHAHLGQLITYAAGKEAGVVIWIAPTFRDEHRKALEWLNEITGEEKSFFGIELELLKVDESLPAVHFKVVVQPNAWVRSSKRATQPITSRQEAYREFFEVILEEVKRAHPGLTRASRAFPQSWLSFPVGRTGFNIAAAFAQSNVFRVELYIDPEDRDRAKRAFDDLYAQRETIEQRLGTTLTWQRLDERRASRVYVGRSGQITDSPEHLRELQIWAVDKIGEFHRVFRPLVQKLVL